MNVPDPHHRVALERGRDLRRSAARRRSRRAALLPTLRNPAVRRLQRRYNLVSALGWFATVLPAAVTVLLAQARGLDLAQIGLVLGVYSLTVALLEVPTGGLADAVGRKRVALLAGGLTLLAKGAFLLAFSLPAFLLYAVLYGAARALGSGALEAWFVDALQEAEPGIDLQPPLARAGTAELLALGAASLVGGLLPRLAPPLPAEGTAILTPLAVPVLASMAMHGVALVATALLVREPPRPAPAGARRGLGAVLGDALALTRENPTLRLLLGVGVVNGLALAGVEGFWQPFFAGPIGLGEERTALFGVILAGCFGLGVVGTLVATPLSRRLGRRHARAAALLQVVQALTLAGLARQGALPGAAAALWLVFLARAAASSPLAALFNAEVPAGRRSVMLSVQSLATFAGFGLGNLGLGFVAQATSIATAWSLAAGVVALGVVPLLAVDRRRRGGRAGLPPSPLAPDAG